MSQADVRRVVEGTHAAFGRQWFYRFRALSLEVHDAEAVQFIERVQRLVAGECLSWSDAKTSEWCVRHYSASRLILAGTVLARSIEYAEEHNLRMLVPHGAYYLALSALRAIVMTAPLGDQHSLEAILEMSHGKTISIAGDIIRRLRPALGERIEGEVRRLRAVRELIDYRAPTSGDPERDRPGYIRIARFGFELAQLQSELRERALEKRGVQRTRLREEHMLAAIEHVIEGIQFWDDDDWRRVDYLDRKHGFPANLYHLISEGHVDDVMIAWRNAGGDHDAFDPEAPHAVHIFDLP